MKKKTSFLPDITQSPSTSFAYSLDKVGMKGIETIVTVKNTTQAKSTNAYVSIPAKVNIMVNLIKPQTKGIHMSRLYKIIYEQLGQKKFSPALLEKVIQECIASQKGISNQGFIRLAFTLPIKQKSLLSDNAGYRHYPIVLEGEIDQKGHFKFNVQIELLYSSTCPCSAALSVDFHDKKNKPSDSFKQFLATPHAQRSVAKLTLVFKDKVSENFLLKYIKDLEKIIKTPVQSAVKREDEQEFARLNAENLMFCEDAARIFKHFLEHQKEIADYKIEVTHLESLHAHDASAIAVKGIGLQA